MKLNWVFGATFVVAFNVLAGGCASVPAAFARETTIPIDLSGPRPTVSVRIGDSAPEAWVLDTGSGGSVITVDRAHALGLPEQQPVRIGSPAGGTPLEGFLTTVPSMSIGEVTINDVGLAAIPGPPSAHTGVLSPNVFAGRLVEFDFADSVVRIRDASEAPTSGATPYVGEGGRALPTLPVTVPGQVLNAYIDTGAVQAVTFPYEMAASLPLAAPPERVGVVRFVDGEHARYRAQVLGQVHVGPLTLRDPTVDFIDGLPFVNVGMEALRQLTITLDPAGQRSWAVLG